jgi:hypothetical protein
LVAVCAWVVLYPAAALYGVFSVGPEAVDRRLRIALIFGYAYFPPVAVLLVYLRCVELARIVLCRHGTRLAAGARAHGDRLTGG